MIKVICIFVNESHRLPLTLNQFYSVEDVGEVFSAGSKPFKTYFVHSEDKTQYYGIYDMKDFMTMEQLAEWREQQMKNILE